MKTVILCVIASVACALNAPAEETRFDKANREFGAGNFKAAIADYEAEVASAQWSANLFYDLGNAYFRDGNVGRAILNYERALQIDRHHPEAEANLRMARDQTRALELTPSSLEKYLNAGGTTASIIAAAVFFWLAVILSVVRRVGVAAASLVVSAACAWAAYTLENGVHGKGAAVVVAENTQARVATADTARSILALPAGSEVLILQERGDWNYAVLPNDQRGWVAAKAAEKVRLVAQRLRHEAS